LNEESDEEEEKLREEEREREGTRLKGRQLAKVKEKNPPKIRSVKRKE
jgi:hypothetical protein